MPEGRTPLLPVLLFSATCSVATALILHLVGQPFQTLLSLGPVIFRVPKSEIDIGK